VLADLFQFTERGHEFAVTSDETDGVAAIAINAGEALHLVLTHRECGAGLARPGCNAEDELRRLVRHTRKAGAGLIAQDDDGELFLRAHSHRTAITRAAAAMREPAETVFVADVQAETIMT